MDSLILQLAEYAIGRVVLHVINLWKHSVLTTISKRVSIEDVVLSFSVLQESAQYPLLVLTLPVHNYTPFSIQPRRFIANLCIDGAFVEHIENERPPKLSTGSAEKKDSAFPGKIDSGPSTISIVLVPPLHVFLAGTPTSAWSIQGNILSETAYGTLHTHFDMLSLRCEKAKEAWERVNTLSTTWVRTYCNSSG